LPALRPQRDDQHLRSLHSPMRFSGTLIATSRSSSRAMRTTDCPGVTTWPARR
jgi:hypothetical protein